MTKKRKIHASPMKMEAKNDSNVTNDYQMAKGRLKGVLKQLSVKTDSDESADEKVIPASKPRLDQTDVEQQRRRRRPEPIPVSYRHTYVMKLFDRSVDLAKFEEDTPLYPICRAWIQNQPRNPQMHVRRRHSSSDINGNVDDVGSGNSGNEVELNKLPPPKGHFGGRIPSPLPEQIDQHKNNIDLDYTKSQPPSKEDLMNGHRYRWAKVKRKWVEKSAEAEQRYTDSCNILKSVYKRAQSKHHINS